jgi:ubiquinone/menaquinone biosynthesis C-methylase UbiE
MKEEDTNRAHWDEIAPVHLRSYGIEGLLAGTSRIDALQKQELYPIDGMDLIHLQCHIGTDTLSLALDGATVTGVDFSAKSIAIARELTCRMGLKAEFIHANVFELTPLMSKQYDIVYTSKGVLCWIRDIDRWAKTISNLLKDNGTFYILETHPMVSMFDDTKEGIPPIKHPYFHQSEAIHFEDRSPDYSDSSYIPKNTTYEWIWSLSDIVNSLIRNGMQIELLNEHDRLFYKAFPGMVRTEDDWWMLGGLEGKVPLSFSIRARKLARRA